MPSLMLRDLAPALIERLRAEARAQQQSVPVTAAALLAEALALREVSRRPRTAARTAPTPETP